MLERLKSRARALKTEIHALYLAAKDPRTPWYVKVIALLTVAYALSPIDLIPDFVPVLGYLDDLIIVPAGIALTIKLIPPEVMEEARRNARQVSGPESLRRASSRRSMEIVGAIFIAFVWIVVAIGVVCLVFRTQ